MKNNYNKRFVVFLLSLFFLSNSLSFLGIHAEETHLTTDCDNLNGDDDLVGYWSFDEATDDITEDQSDYDKHGEIYGAKWTTDGYLGNALEFDGEWDYVLVQDDDSLNFADSNEFTIDFWFKWNGRKIQEKVYAIVDKRIDKKSGGFNLAIDSNDKLCFSIGDGFEIYSVRSENPVDNQWHRVTAVWDGYTQFLFIDGEVVDIGEIPNFIISDCAKPLEIGNNWGYADNLNTFDGIIDEVRIYEKAKSYNEIEGILKIEVPKDNNEDRLKTGGVFNIGGSCSLSWPFISDIQVKLEGQNGVSTSWENATGWDLWSYEANISSFPTGKVTIKARCLNALGNPITNIGVIEKIIYYDPDVILPEVILKNPLGSNLLSGIIDIEGEVKDNNNKTSSVQILIDKYMDDWQDVFVIHHEDRNDEWLYKFDTLKDETVEPGKPSSYIVYIRVKDDEFNEYNKTYWSPIYKYNFRVDNYFPESATRIPQDKYIHLFYDRTRRKIFNLYSEKTIIFGKLTCEIEVLQNHEYVDGVNFFVNSDNHPFRGANPSGSNPCIWICDEWNDFEGFGLFNLEVNLHIRVFKESGHACEMDTKFMKIY